MRLGKCRFLILCIQLHRNYINFPVFSQFFLMALLVDGYLITANISFAYGIRSDLGNIAFLDWHIFEKITKALLSYLSSF